MSDPTQSSRRPQRGDLIEAEVVDLAERDTCVARTADDMAIFVRGIVAVGDRVRVEVIKSRKSYLDSRLVEILTPSASRVQPTCPHFGTCGGCKWQHVDYTEQLRLKRKRVSDTLERIGGFEAPPVAEVLAAEDTFHYRNKMEFSFSRQRYLLATERETPLNKPVDYALGMHAPRLFNKVVDIDQCYIATPAMNTALDVGKRFGLARGLSVYSTETDDGFLRNLAVRAGQHTGELMVNLVTREHDAEVMQALLGELQAALGAQLTTLVNNVTTKRNTSTAGEQEFVIYGPGTITEKLGTLHFTISANSFFQTNSRQAELLYEQALLQAEPRESDVLWDLYCGTGSLTLYAASRCRRILGLELVESAVADARVNARRNGMNHARFAQVDLNSLRHWPDELSEYRAPDVVIVDPPRAGLHAKVLALLAEVAPRRLVYVSCNPASLARDAKLLCESGYTLGDVVPIDMFPHTNHIECVARLDR